MAHKTTVAYRKLRNQIQESFDFVYVVAQAVPCLKLQAGLVGKKEIEKLPNPDYFQKPNPIKLVRKQAQGYKSELAKYVLLSSFSYFEAFVVEAIEELIEFNGGAEKFSGRAKSIAKRTIIKQKGKHTKDKIKLSKKDPHDAPRRRICTQRLISEHFVFPSALLSHLGVTSLAEKLSNLRSVNIPHLMKDGFCLDLSGKEIECFHHIRNKRNDIAHGNPVKLKLKDVIEMNTALKSLAKKFDKHLVNNFFISEEFV